jgi:hypothetical protein
MAAEQDQPRYSDTEMFLGITNAIGQVEQAMDDFSSALTEDRKIVVVRMLSKLITDVTNA